MRRFLHFELCEATLKSLTIPVFAVVHLYSESLCIHLLRSLDEYPSRKLDPYAKEISTRKLSLKCRLTSSIRVSTHKIPQSLLLAFGFFEPEWINDEFGGVPVTSLPDLMPCTPPPITSITRYS